MSVKAESGRGFCKRIRKKAFFRQNSVDAKKHFKDIEIKKYALLDSNQSPTA